MKTLQILAGGLFLLCHCVAAFQYFNDPPSYGDLVLTKDNNKYVCISLAPDGIENHKYVLPVCGDNLYDLNSVGSVISRQLGYKTCALTRAENIWGISFGYKGIKCAGSESHILRCNISSPQISEKHGCSNYVRVSCRQEDSLYFTGTKTGNKAYHGQVLIHPSSPTSRGIATASMGLVAVKEEGESCSYWRFINNSDSHVDLTLSTTLCRQMGFTHVSAVMTKKIAEELYGMNFSLWLKKWIGFKYTIATSDIKCGKVSHECLSCCNYPKYLSCGNDEVFFGTKPNDSLLVLRCSFYQDKNTLSEGGKQCAYKKGRNKAKCDQATFGDVRLQDGDSTRGRVEYYQNYEWNTICSVGFDRNDANLICKRLGFISVDKFGNASSLGVPAGSIDQPIYHLSCEDDSPSSCSAYVSSRDHSLDVAVTCINESQAIFNDVRLRDGNATKGRIEYFQSSEWHTISSVGFDQEEADLMCKRLGFVSADKFGKASSLNVPVGSNDQPICHVSCQDESPSSCSIYSDDDYDNDDDDDDHSLDVAISCRNGTNTAEASVTPFEKYILPGVLGFIILILIIIILLIGLKCFCNQPSQRQEYQNLDSAHGCLRYFKKNPQNDQ